VCPSLARLSLSHSASFVGRKKERRVITAGRRYDSIRGFYVTSYKEDVADGDKEVFFDYD